ncbi:MAG: transposase, partial [Sutterella wadsworthensis]
ENFGGELGQALVECVNVKRQLEHAKASVRCSIEWCFLWLKRIYGYAKVRYRGLAKNHSRALTLFALYNCNRLRKWCAPPRLPC